jgi:hypothetical protein
MKNLVRGQRYFLEMEGKVHFIRTSKRRCFVVLMLCLANLFLYRGGHNEGKGGANLLLAHDLDTNDTCRQRECLYAKEEQEFETACFLPSAIINRKAMKREQLGDCSDAKGGMFRGSYLHASYRNFAVGLLALVDK